MTTAKCPECDQDMNGTVIGRTGAYRKGQQAPGKSSRQYQCQIHGTYRQIGSKLLRMQGSQPN